VWMVNGSQPIGKDWRPERLDWTEAAPVWTSSLDLSDRKADCSPFSVESFFLFFERELPIS
jgi:hypothetical protein